VVIIDILRKNVIGKLSICMDRVRDNKYRAINSQSLWIDLSSHCSQGLVEIVADLEVRGRGPKAWCYT
jgi:hypothetical protein